MAHHLLSAVLPIVLAPGALRTVDLQS